MTYDEVLALGDGDIKVGMTRFLEKTRMRHPYRDRIEALEAALLKMINGCHMCLGRGKISSWDVNSGQPLVSCPDCKEARATLRGTA